MIKLADQSEHGWKMVAEYESNPVASDSDDEKRIYKAEARASRKSRIDRGGRRGRWRSYPYRRTFRRTVDLGDNNQPQTQQTKRAGICFACSMPGHWKFECPTVKAANNNKISNNYSLIARKGMDRESLGHVIINEGAEESKEKSSSAESTVLSPAGRLAKAYDKWKEITDDQYILEVIKQGYKLPFKESPPEVYIKNNSSARDNMPFVQEEVKNLVQKGIVSEVTEIPKVVNPLTVAFNKNGKPRLVLDCRHINEYLHSFKFKYEDIKVAEDMFKKGSFLFTYDLKSAYHSIDINPLFRTWLGFSIHKQEDGTKRYYVFNSLPFGLSTAGHIFSKTLRVVIKFWRANGHKIIMFLDDGIGGSTRLEKALESSKVARETLLSLGFLLATEKCRWMPELKVTWLGNTIDMGEGKIFITAERITRLEMAIDSLLYQIDKDQYNLIPVRFLASVVGQIISLQNVIGKKVRLLTRQMYKCILSRASWNAPVIVTESAKSELLYWRENARILNDFGKCLDRKTFYEFRLFADASSTGYGGYIETYGNAIEESSEMLMGDTDCKSIEVGDLGSRGKMHLGLIDADTTEPPEEGLAMYPEMGQMKPSERGKGMSPEVDKSKLEMVSTGLSTIIQSKWEHFVSPEVDFQRSSPEVDKKQYVEKSCLIANHFNGSFPSWKQSARGKGEKIKPVERKRLYGVVFGDWDDIERSRSSTWRESETVRRLIYSNINILQNKKIKIFSDNKNVESVLQAGSGKEDLQKIASDICEICERHGIQFSPEWIPRGENQRADELSRYGDNDDWSISDAIFSVLNLKWGPHTIDRFASTYNTKCCRFNSRFWVPGTESVNSLDQKWSGENNWVVPPPKLILKCIQKIQCEEANCTLIIPLWKSAPFWPELLYKDSSFKYFVSESFLLPSQNVIVKGRGNNGIFARSRLSFRMIALKIRF